MCHCESFVFARACISLYRERNNIHTMSIPMHNSIKITVQIFFSFFSVFFYFCTSLLARIYNVANAPQSDAKYNTFFCSSQRKQQNCYEFYKRTAVPTFCAQADETGCDSRGGDKYKKMLIMIFRFSLFSEDRRFDSHNLKMVMVSIYSM